MLTDMLDLVEVEVPSLKVLAVKFVATAEHGVEFNIETPRRGETTNALALFVSGWAGMAGRKISNVLIRTSRRTLICTRSPRPDLAGRFGASEAARAGFFAELRVFDLVGTAEAEILAEIEGGDSCVLARLTVQASGRARSDLVGIPPSGLSSLPTLLTINSLGRSGTSLLMGRLLRHPQIGGYAVAPFESRFVQRASLQTMFSITNTRSPYFENNRWYSDSFSSLTWFEDAAAAEELRQILVQTELSRLTNIVLDYRALLQRKTGRQISVICEKTIVGDIARFLAWFWPRSKTVILVRDLRDMLCSFIAFDQKRGFSSFSKGINQDPELYFSRLSVYVSQLQNMRRDNSNSTLIVRYEDLVLNPRACLKEILDFCEIEAGSVAVDRCLAETPAAQDFQKTHSTSPSARSSIGRWRQDLPPEAHDYYEKQLKSVNAYFGYN